MSKKSKFLKTEEQVQQEVSQQDLSKILEFNIKEYGMSVIEDRMIPSIRDGLKPSQRRLLKAMYDLKAWNTAPTVKSARVTGECFTGDTSILDVNGNEILISDLYDKIDRGESVYTFSSKLDGSIVASKVIKCWISSEVDEIVEVTLDNGLSFRCTKEHKILGRSGSYGSYIEAGNLEEGASLMPVYKVKSVRFIHLDHKIPVYNIEVDSEEHNFALACGTFAKNCMGKYHPHSEAYGALGGLVNQTYSLVQGQGNWGSLDDEPAAARYTECRFSKLGQRCFENYAVADEVPNFSGEYMEPIDIPMDFPLFFVNGGKGIGVAVRLETPDHNLQEIVEAMKIVLKKGDKTKMSDLFKVFHGPDSVYGGKLLTSEEELKTIYETGSGKITYECDYEITPQGRNRFLLTVTGYCPEFKPSDFQNAMIKLMADKNEKSILNANDASTKDSKCNFQVLYEGEDTFEKRIHKHLIKSQYVQYYALDRRKSATPQLRDIDTVLLKKSFIEYMQIWLDWRREQETKLLSIRANEIDDRMFHVECRMNAAENVKVIQAALAADDAVAHLTKNMPYLMGHPRAKEGSEYILDLKIGSIKKTDMQKMRLEFGELDQELQRVKKDMSDIDRVVSRKLDSLKEFFKPRMLKY